MRPSHPTGPEREPAPLQHPTLPSLLEAVRMERMQLRGQNHRQRRLQVPRGQVRPGTHLRHRHPGQQRSLYGRTTPGLGKVRLCQALQTNATTPAVGTAQAPTNGRQPQPPPSSPPLQRPQHPERHATAADHQQRVRTNEPGCKPNNAES
uniref:(northern house mosquito) hypothetical protein n=1 Tax=Culex pipiens TaxID=7175 RepID=A0A8D8A8C5_CULPI